MENNVIGWSLNVTSWLHVMMSRHQVFTHTITYYFNSPTQDIIDTKKRNKSSFYHICELRKLGKASFATSWRHAMLSHHDWNTIALITLNSTTQIFIKQMKNHLSNKSTSSYKTRNSLKYHVPYSRTSCRQNVAQNFGPRLWNSLLRDIVTMRSLNHFKIHVKQFLLNWFWIYLFPIVGVLQCSRFLFSFVLRFLYRLYGRNYNVFSFLFL